jgi:peptidoglycan/LPS O-acetylase OafA/YrhL
MTDGGYGVQFFFLLSGFLITNLLLKELTVRGTVSLKIFYLKRILRIWPLYFILLAFTYVAYLEIYVFRFANQPRYDIYKGIAYYLSFLSNFEIIRSLADGTNHRLAMLNPTWSVSIEEQFYIIWPIVILTFRRHLVLAFSLILAGCVLVRMYLTGSSEVVDMHTISAFPHLVLGGMLAYFVSRYEAVKQFFLRITDAQLIVSYFLILLTIIFLDSIFVGSPSHYRYLCSFLFLWVIATQAFTGVRAIRLERLPLINSTGKYTYDMYLFHTPVIAIIYIILHIKSVAAIIPRNSWVSLGTFVAATCATYWLSRLSYITVEAYFRGLRAKIINNKLVSAPSTH